MLYLTLVFCLFIAGFTNREERKPVIFLIGDSTMATKDPARMNPERGWGEVLPGFLSTGIVVENHARNGRSSRSFRDEGRWEQVAGRIREGDYVFIQFGHNDEKAEDPARYSDPEGAFRENLKRYIRETRERGGIPVLFTPIARRVFKDGALTDTHGAWIPAVKAVAEETQTTLIDLNKSTAACWQTAGDSASRSWFVWVAPGTHPFIPEGREDNTHLNLAGARQVARLAVDEIQEKVPALAPYIQYERYDGAKSLSAVVRNSWNKKRTDAPVVVDLREADPGFVVRSAVVTAEGGEEIPCQLDDLDGDRQADELVFVADVPANSRRTFHIRLAERPSERKYPERVYAQMLVSDKKGKHVPVQSVTVPGTSDIYNQMHHHGPAFESELVAYRIYFDQKQTIDIYGKFRKGFELKEAQFYPDDAQLARGFGDDVLRVSGSCGAGTLKGWNREKATHMEPVAARTERIVAYGPVRTVVEVEVSGWQYQGSELNLTHRYLLYAGHRDLTVETFFDEPLREELFCTGVQDIEGSLSYSDHRGLIACWGTDWPVNDTVKYAKETVGLATWIPTRYVREEVKDKPNYLYTLSAPGEKYLRHHTVFTSLKESFGYKTPEAWFAYVREWKEELEHPLEIEVKTEVEADWFRITR